MSTHVWTGTLDCMAALWFRIRVRLRRRSRELIVAVVLIGFVGGLAMGLAAGSRRTASAPDRYTSWAGGDPDLEITQLEGTPITEQVAAIPGVASAQSVAFVTSFLVGPDGAMVFDSNPFAGDDRISGSRVVEGRFTDPAAPNEFTVNVAMADLLRTQYGSRVGDRFEVVSFDREQVQSNRAFESGEPPAVPPFSATMVGVINTPIDFDEAAPVLYFSRAFLDAHPTVGVIQTVIDVHLDPGADPDRVMTAVRELPGGEGALASQVKIVSDESRRAVRFQATALWIVAAIAMVGSAVVVVQLVGRTLRMSSVDALSLEAVGWRRRDLAAERAIEGLLIAALAAPLGVAVARWMTVPFPLGSLEVFEPSPGADLDAAVSVIGSIAMVAVVTFGALWSGRSGRPAAIGGSARRTVGTVVARSSSMPLAVGAHLAFVGPSGARRSAASLAAGVVGMAALVGTGVVGLSLDTMVDDPARWGVNYDRLFGNPYIAAEDDIIAPVAGLEGVAGLTAAHLGSLDVDGLASPTIAIDSINGGMLPTTLEGRPPTGPDEIGLGAEIARRLNVDVGDQVTVRGSTETTEVLRVVGIVVTPDAAGGGAAVAFDTYAALNPTATRNLMLVNFEADAPADLEDQIAAINFSPPDALPTPGSVEALRRVLPAPVVLAAVLTLLLLVGCGLLVTITVRARRRDLAVLRALGARPRQLQTTVHWQATLVAATVVILGVPLGIIAGRSVVQQLTSTLGIVPGVDVSAVMLTVVVVGAIVAANLLALVPASHAGRTAQRELLRDR